LAILLCSFFIYNSIGTIDDAALDNVALVLNMTKSIKATSNEADVSIKC
jgi:hypothetical protein